MNAALFILMVIAVLTIPTSIMALPELYEPTYYTSFTILGQNTTVPGGWVFPGDTSQLFDPVKNATVTATPTKPDTYPQMLLAMMGMVYTHEYDTSVPQETGITDDEGVVVLPLYDIIKYNVTVNRDNKPEFSFLIIPSENDYRIYLGG
jgi:hypothetical protein